MARAIANESMVLLKNDGTLPLKQARSKSRWLGRSQIRRNTCLATTTEFRRTQFRCWKASRQSFLKRRSTLCPGTQFLRKDGDAVPASVFTTSDGQPGLKLEFATGDIFGEKTDHSRHPRSQLPLT